MDSGRLDLATLNYRHSLALNPRNAGAENVLRRISQEVPKSELSETANRQSSRTVQDGSIISKELPAAAISFANDFIYVGSQVVQLYGTAEAEQFLFAVSGTDGRIQKFYWIQFERLLGKNGNTYQYRSQTPLSMGGLPFSYDVKNFPDYAAALANVPGSDGAAVIALAAAHHLRFPANTARVRMIHLPTSDRRAELMIIYGESLPPDGQIPFTPERIGLEGTSPDSARLMLTHALQGLNVTTR